MATAAKMTAPISRSSAPAISTQGVRRSGAAAWETTERSIIWVPSGIGSSANARAVSRGTGVASSTGDAAFAPLSRKERTWAIDHRSAGSLAIVASRIGANQSAPSSRGGSSCTMR